ncbi:MAG: PDGLE domain-containing protein [Geobacteraceae bacterium]|nr:PDGLE domain-containing protein [Geobacteraceae bacterium]
MHMADALLSPAVGGAMLAAAAGSIAYCSAKVRKEVDDRKVPLMGVLGAFLFAAQMINFTIPATGSSGHLGGGLLLTILLGPYAAFLTIASVLVVQALFFADGGLLALGCNIINLGIFPAFIAYPFIYRPIAGLNPSTARTVAASLAAGVAGLQLGAFAVVLETTLSGISALPFTAFVSMMQPIHLGIGIVEGIVTALIVGFVHKARPDIFTNNDHSSASIMKSIIPGFLALALITGGFVSWFASQQPDGLEWSINKVTGKEELAGSKDGIHGALSGIQEKLAFLPDYNFKKPEVKNRGEQEPQANDGKKGGNRLGTSLSGIVGALITLGLAVLVGLILRKRQEKAAMKPHAHEHAHPHGHGHEHPHRHGDQIHSHEHFHEHSHPHPHVHDHSAPHPEDPNPRHSHEVRVAEHSHDHPDHEHESHEHKH